MSLSFERQNPRTVFWLEQLFGVREVHTQRTICQGNRTEGNKIMFRSVEKAQCEGTKPK